MIIDINPNDLPLCPNSGSYPRNPLHDFHNIISDVASDSAETDPESSEFVDAAAEKMYEAVAYGRFNGRMHLYKEGVTDISRGVVTYIYVWYFKCNICGLILPATGAETSQ